MGVTRFKGYQVMAIPTLPGLYGYNFDLLDVAFFLFTALLVIWVWWGVPKWQVAVTFIAIGACLSAVTLLAFFGVKFTSEGMGFGPMPHFLLTIRLAPWLGVLVGGLLSLLLGAFRKDSR